MSTFSFCLTGFLCHGCSIFGWTPKLVSFSTIGAGCLQIGCPANSIKELKRTYRALSPTKENHPLDCGRSERDKLDRRRSTKLTIPPRSVARPLQFITGDLQALSTARFCLHCSRRLDPFSRFCTVHQCVSSRQTDQGTSVAVGHVCA